MCFSVQAFFFLFDPGISPFCVDRDQLSADRLSLEGVVAAVDALENILIRPWREGCSFGNRAHLPRRQQGKSLVAEAYNKQEEETGLPKASVHFSPLQTFRQMKMFLRWFLGLHLQGEFQCIPKHHAAHYGNATHS